MNLTLEELALYNGSNGYPAYVAVNGTIYDVTDIKSWASGTHFDLQAGADLTSQFNCHAGQLVLGKLKRVGVIF